MKNITLVVIMLSLAGCAFGNKKINTSAEYAQALKRHVTKRLYLPEDYSDSYQCSVNVRQDNDGNIVDVSFEQCDESESLMVSIDNAISDSSPLPLPDDMTLFDSELVFHFCPKCEE